MPAPVNSVALYGHEALVIDVECRISRGLPALLIVGLANRAVNEAKERIRGAFAASRLKLPPQRIAINLAPGDLPKDGTSFDLAIATAVLLASHPEYQLEAHCIILGELGLDGSVRPVRGLIGALLGARASGYTTFYIPAQQYTQAALVPGLALIPVQSLSEVQRALSGAPGLLRRLTGPGQLPLQSAAVSKGVTLGQITGQAQAKRALEIAAAGQHNTLLIGAPGTGKSLLAKALPSILPPLTQEQILEVTHLHSLANHHYDQLVTHPPLRAPHHSASTSSIIGGLYPGEISLAHRGVLLLDELPEFARSTLEALRQPLEDKQISICRARGSLTLPANFILIATANPCPCGYYRTGQTCRCPPHRRLAYQQKLSGPLLDRIDLYVEADNINHAALLATTTAETDEITQQRVARTRQHQYSRQAGRSNAELENHDLKIKVGLASAAKDLLDTAAARLQLSARGYIQTIKVARTIADLAGDNQIQTAYITEALQYRQRKNP